MRSRRRVEGLVTRRLCGMGIVDGKDVAELNLIHKTNKRMQSFRVICFLTFFFEEVVL